MAFNWGKKMTKKQENDQQEMSMEEILASIRKYVTEEQGQQKVLLETLQPTPIEQPLDSKPFDLTEEMEEKNISDTHESETRRSQDSQNTQTTFSQVVPLTAGQGDTILSAQAIESTSAALNKLKSLSKPQNVDGDSAANSLTIDKLMADLARPLIKEWLDKNLPSLVEKLVEKEIKSLSHRMGL